MKFCIEVLILLVFIVLTNHLPQSESFLITNTEIDCEGKIAETIPIGLTYNSSIISYSTFDELISLISNAKQSIDIASFYWTLLGTDVMPKPDESSLKGKILLHEIINASKTRSVKIRIAVNEDANSLKSTDLQLLKSVADIRELNFSRLVGAGILHTKFIIVDNKHFYIGSANMDWRSLTHVKEMGIVMSGCEVLALDLYKIFEVYWYLGLENATIPERWPKEFSTNYNNSNPLLLSINESNYEVFLSSAPKSFCSDGRTNDIEAIISIINKAKKFIYIAVMDYYPIFLYSKHKHFWPVIDDALRKAAIERRVNIKLLASHWNHTRHSMPIYLRSLAALNDSHIIGGSIQVKLFVVPAFSPSQAQIPFARVNHNKYMVTENTAYIGTSNWSADYFVDTGGVGFAIIPKSNETNLRNDLQSIFERDWHSSYAKTL
jgi:phospholipase D3/4